MSESSSTINLGGAPTILTVLFVLLKVFGKIEWSWWWVFSPMWISAAFMGFVLLAVLMISVAVAVAKR